MEELVLVSKDELHKILEESSMATALLGCGVDSWEGYEDAISLYLESKNDMIADFYVKHTLPLSEE